MPSFRKKSSLEVAKTLRMGIPNWLDTYPVFRYKVYFQTLEFLFTLWPAWMSSLELIMKSKIGCYHLRNISKAIRFSAGGLHVLTAVTRWHIPFLWQKLLYKQNSKINNEPIIYKRVVFFLKTIERETKKIASVKLCSFI